MDGKRVAAAAGAGWILAAAAAGPLAGQHEHGGHASPYAGQQTSEIPSLTERELEDLRTGAGMGLARPAELNHYPGPKHVLELAGDLGLSADQLTRIEEIHRRMEDAAVEAGAAVIDAERTLNARFSHGHIDEASLDEAVALTAELSGRLRFVHLRAHLETAGVLTPEQIAEYDRLRGYAPPPGR